MIYLLFNVRLNRSLAIIAAAVCITACGTVPFNEARTAYQRGDFEQATTALSSSRVRSKDKLLALMEQGSIWHEAGDYQRSSSALLQAVELLSSTDYVSVSENAAALAVNEWTKTYRGESAERLWIHTYQIMNFLLLGKNESAAVEARQALALLAESGNELQQDHFTRAMLAAAFDSVKLYNNAYIEYRKLSEALPSNSLLSDLRNDRALRSGIPLSAKITTQSQLPKGAEGELVLFVASGDIPRKVAGDLVLYPADRISFPIYDINTSPAPDLSLTIDSQSKGESETITPGITTDLGSIARNALAARGTKIAASQIARTSIKHALVKATEEDSESAAALLGFVFFVVEQADTRSWVTLPGYLSLLRVSLPPGDHSVTVHNNAAYANRSQTIDNILISPGRTTYHRIRF